MSKADFRLSERAHRYGSNVHLLANPFYEQMLARFCHEKTVQPEANRLVRSLSTFLISEAANVLFPRTQQILATRMSKTHKEAKVHFQGVDPQTRAVVVDLMRAGILPAQTAYEHLHEVLPAKNIRQDHLLLNRVVNKNQEVVGVKVSGHKIGGPINGAYVFLPDPMGATGSTIENVIGVYRKMKLGKPKKFIAIHFIVTPEYLKRLQPMATDLEIFALRLDRGLSSGSVLKTKLGEKWPHEKGLNEKQYIVPGAGGIGEILNNSFV